MKIHRLTRAEGNWLVDRVKRRGLDPLDFTWHEVDKLHLHHTEWVHQPTGYSFQFQAFEDRATIHYPSRWMPPIDGRVTATSSRRSEQLAMADRWLTAVKSEHDTPDLWKAIEGERELLASSPADANAPF